MELRIDPQSAVPIYAQVVDQVKALVASRALRPGDPVPSIRDLAAALRINRNTAAKAYQALESEGILLSRAGQKSVIADGGPRWSREERRRRLRQAVERLLVEAHHLEMEPQEVQRALEESIRAQRHPDSGRTE